MDCSILQVAGVQARAKVALKPGRSLMDWIRLGKNNKDLAGTGGKLLKVTPEELAKHNTVKDCWTSIRGMYVCTGDLQGM